MRGFLLFICFSIVIWYLAKAVLRHYLAGSSNSAIAERQEPEPGSQNRAGSGGQQQTPYENVRDVRYRDVE